MGLLHLYEFCRVPFPDSHVGDCRLRFRSKAACSIPSPPRVPWKRVGHFHVMYRLSIIMISCRGTASRVSSYATPTMSADHAHSSTVTPSTLFISTSRKLMAQKTVRAKRAVYCQTFLLFVFTLTSLGLSWTLGRYDYHIAIQILLVVAMAIIWWLQGRRLMDAIEKHVKLKNRRHKTVQPSETAEWINLIIKKW